MSEQNFPTSSLHEIFKKVQNRFLVTSAVSKRARQIKEGAKPMIDYDPDSPLGYVDIALKELELGKYDIFIQKSDQNEQDILEEMNESLDRDIERESESELNESKEKKGRDKARDKSKTS